MRKAIHVTGLAITLFLFAGLCSTARSAGPIKIVKVMVRCKGDDIPGGRVCSALKEKIRASSGFQLVGEKEAQQAATSLGVMITSLDIEVPEKNIHSALGVVFIAPMPENKPDYFIRDYLYVVGSEKTDEIAASIMADLDQESGVIYGN